MNWQRFHFALRVSCIAVILAAVAYHVIVRRRNRLEPSRVEEMDRRGDPGYTEFLEADTRFSEEGPRAMGNTESARDLAATLLVHADTIDDGEKPRVYCLKYKKYCVFLVYMPGIRHIRDKENQEIVDKLWPHAQRLAKEQFDGYPTIVIGLRNGSDYGPISVGGKDGEPIYSQIGGSYIFYPYFAGEHSLLQAIAERRKED